MTAVAVLCREHRHAHCSVSGCGCYCHGADEARTRHPRTAYVPPANVKGYRGPDVCRIVGITYRQLDYWDRTKLLCPSVSRANGSGTQRVYSAHDLRRMLVIKAMLDNGLSLQRARAVVEALDAAPEQWADSYLLIGDHRFRTANDAESLVRALLELPQPMSMLLDIDVVTAPLRELAA